MRCSTVSHYHQTRVIFLFIFHFSSRRRQKLYNSLHSLNFQICFTYTEHAKTMTIKLPHHELTNMQESTNKVKLKSQLLDLSLGEWRSTHQHGQHSVVSVHSRVSRDVHVINVVIAETNIRLAGDARFAEQPLIF